MKTKKETDENQLIKMENMVVDINQKLEIQDSNFEKLMFIYSLALREVEHRMNIVKDEYEFLYKYNLVDNIKTRIKEPSSIIKKMKKKNLEVTYRNMIEFVNDIGGIRVICPLKKDIYTIRNILNEQDGIYVNIEKDYIKEPKKSGYKSYHMVLDVPVKLSEKTIYVKIETQIRTTTMDLWSNIEHKVRYKTDKNITKKQDKEWEKCAKMISKIEEKMLKLST